MSKAFLAVCWLILSLVGVTPVAAQTNAVITGNDGKTYRVRLNGVFAKICAGRAVQLTSPSDGRVSAQDIAIGVDTGAASEPLSLSGDNKHITPFPLDKVKKDEYLRDVWLTTHLTTVPFDIEMKDVRVTAANIRSNGTWTMTLGWSSCTNRPKKQ